MQGQRVLLGSAMFGAGGNGAATLCFERRGTGHFEVSVGMARANYLLALATDGALPLLPPSIYVDADRLLHMDGPMLERILAGQPPPQAAACIGQLEASAAELEAQSRRAEQERQKLVTETRVGTTGCPAPRGRAWHGGAGEAETRRRIPYESDGP